jgi:hypothetical protein
VTLPLPDQLRSKATDRNIPAEAIPELWRQHAAWCEAHNVTAGGKPWESFLDAVVTRAAETRALSDSESRRLAERARTHAEERRAREAADAEYALHAVNLSDWLADVRARGDFAEAITAHEQRLIDFRAPMPGEDVAGWLMAALR